jgi:hypothetical protein
MYAWKFESRMHIMNLCVPWKIASWAENLDLQVLQFE